MSSHNCRKTLSFDLPISTLQWHEREEALSLFIAPALASPAALYRVTTSEDTLEVTKEQLLSESDREDILLSAHYWRKADAKCMAVCSYFNQVNQFEYLPNDFVTVRSPVR